MGRSSIRTPASWRIYDRTAAAISVALFLPLAGLTIAGQSPFSRRQPVDPAPLTDVTSEPAARVEAQPEAATPGPSPSTGTPAPTADTSPITPPVPKLVQRPPRTASKDDALPAERAAEAATPTVDTSVALPSSPTPTAVNETPRPQIEATSSEAKPVGIAPAQNLAANESLAPAPAAASPSAEVKNATAPPAGVVVAVDVIDKPAESPTATANASTAEANAAKDSVATESVAKAPVAQGKAATTTPDADPAPEPAAPTTAEAEPHSKDDTPDRVAEAAPIEEPPSPAATAAARAKTDAEAPAKAATGSDTIVPPKPVPAKPRETAAKAQAPASAKASDSAATETRDQKFTTTVALAKPQPGPPAAPSKPKPPAPAAAAPASPPSVAYRKSADRIIVYGRVHDEQERAAVLKAAGNVFSGRQLINHVAVDAAVGPVAWLDKAEAVVGLLQGLDGTGRIVVDGDEVTLSGFVTSESELVRHGEQAAKLFGPAAKVKNRLKSGQ